MLSTKAESDTMSQHQHQVFEDGDQQSVLIQNGHSSFEIEVHVEEPKGRERSLFSGCLSPAHTTDAPSLQQSGFMPHFILSVPLSGLGYSVCPISFRISAGLADS
jgi:hypothetical protein